MVMIIDGHEDLAYNAVDLSRNLLGSVADIRQQEGMIPAHGEGTATVSLPAMRQADVRIVFSTIFTYPAVSTVSVVPPGYHSSEEAFQRARAQINFYHRLQQNGEATLVCDQESLDAVVHQQSPLPGLCLLMEGADPIRTPADLEWFVERGVRITGLSWKGTRYAGGTGAPGPLTDLGRELLHEMDRLGVVLDVSHLAEEAFWQAMTEYKGCVIASHANCRSLVPGERQLSDDMIKAIAERDGVIGLVCYNRFIRADWHSGDSKMGVNLDDLRRHADHLATLVGVRHIGLGTDLDGGIGREVVPREIDTIADLPRFADVLAQAGYHQEDINAIMGDNWLRVLRGVLLL